MSESDTPRTDAEAGYYDDSGCWKSRSNGDCVDADFARTLERELSAALARAEKAELAHQSAVDAIKDEIACNHEFMAKGGAQHDENITQFQDRLIAERDAALATVARLRSIVNEQAEDEGLWFIADTMPEAYLQQELRRLHTEIEANPLPDVKEASRG